MEDLSDIIFTVLRPGKMDRLFTVVIEPLPLLG